MTGEMRGGPRICRVGHAALMSQPKEKDMADKKTVKDFKPVIGSTEGGVSVAYFREDIVESHREMIARMIPELKQGSKLAEEASKHLRDTR